MAPVIDPASITWDGRNGCWIWSTPAGQRYFDPQFHLEFNRAEQPRKAQPTRYWPTFNTRLAMTLALSAAGAVAGARYRELEDARRAIQIRRQAEHLEGVVVVTECSHCGAPPPPRGHPCRYCGTIAPG